MITDPNDVLHLSVDIVLEIHQAAIASFGGSSGIRDLTLLESAVAAPQATIGGESPFHDVIEIGAAYLFYLSRNHPFIDGNKRTALGACLVFLQLNGVQTAPDNPSFEKLAIDLASSTLDREATTQQLRLILKK